MGQNGGKRPGAGRPKGSSSFFKRGDIPEKFADRLMEILSAALESDDQKRKDWAVDQLMPYAFRKQPISAEFNGNLNLNHGGFDGLFADVFGAGSSADATVSGGVADGQESVPHSPESAAS